MKIERIKVLGYFDERRDRAEYQHGWSELCYWCGRDEHEVDLRPFRMKHGGDILVNLTCKECFREYSELGKMRNKRRH